MSSEAKESQPTPNRATGKRHPLLRLKVTLLLFLLCVSLPIFLLFERVYQQMQSDSFYDLRRQAEDLVSRVDQKALEVLEEEEKRPFADYGFLSVEKVSLLKGGSAVKFSPLSQFPLQGNIPGLIGYFQLDPDGTFRSPVLPDLSAEELERFQIALSKEDYQKRAAVKQQLEEILRSNQLLVQVPRNVRQNALPTNVVSDKRETFSSAGSQAPVVAEQDLLVGGVEISARRDKDSQNEAKERTIVDEKNILSLKSNYLGEKVSALKLKRQYEEPERALDEASSGALSQGFEARQQKQQARMARKEQIEVPVEQSLANFQDLLQVPEDISKQSSALKTDEDSNAPKILTFEGEVDPFQFYVLKGKQFVLVRKVWKEKQRFIQGFIVDGQEFIHQVMEKPLRDSSLANIGNLIVAYREEVLRQLAAATRDISEGTVLLQTHLMSPLDEIQLLFTVGQIPLGRGVVVVNALAWILGFVLLGGAVAIYCAAAKQIRLAEQQRDFISAVSHELKTPLTSIRMYSEMLREGWVEGEGKRKSYYDYIFQESERLSRLVANVLQLAKLSRNEFPLELKHLKVGQLLVLVQEKVASQVRASGYELVLRTEEENSVPGGDERMIYVDEDSFVRIFINLIDNALKFSAHAEKKVIELGVRILQVSPREVTITVRDFGPGVPRDQMKKIFQLFYRPGTELTRTTPGTGIGLSLVKELAERMQGKVDLRNVEPGAEFQVTFPIAHNKF